MKRKRLEIAADGDAQGIPIRFDFFDALPDDLVLIVVCKLSATADCPGDFVNLSLTCRRLNGLCLDSLALKAASRKVMAVKARKWSGSAHKFLVRCVESGNLEACYTLGMIRFYCLQQRMSGAALMAKAAMGGHAQALYSLAVIQFNGSGGTKSDKDLRAGVALCARAAFLGHLDGLRELGHCLQDGYGVKKNIAAGRLFLVQANVLEVAVVFRANNSSTALPPAWVPCNSIFFPRLNNPSSTASMTVAHPVNRFLSEWFSIESNACPELRICSHSGCGRPETRRHEFRRCSVCGTVNYCSRACQSLDWKLRHKVECSPFIVAEVDGEDGGDDIFHGGGEF